MVRKIDSLVGSCDIVHIHELWHFPHWMAARSARQHRIPYVVTVHGQTAPWALGHKRLKKALFGRVYQRRLLNNAEAIHVLSAEEAQFVRQYGISTPTILIPNAVGDVRASVHTDCRSLTNARFPELAGKRVILFLSRIHPQKGPDLLLQAFARVSRVVTDAHLLVVGPDEIGMVATLQAEAVRLGCDGSITFAGPVYGAERFDIFGSADVFVLPSRFEGQSIALLEAMSAGLPVVVSPAANSPDVVDVDAGLVAEPTPEGLAQALVQLLENEQERQRRGANGRATVLKDYSWDTIATKHAKLYRHVLGTAATAEMG